MTTPRPTRPYPDAGAAGEKPNGFCPCCRRWEESSDHGAMVVTPEDDDHQRIQRRCGACQITWHEIYARIGYEVTSQ